MKTMASTLVPGYEVTDVLFEGERTQILRGVRLRDHAAVILKVLTAAVHQPAELARFRSEFQISEALNSPYVPSAYDLSYCGDRWMITYEDVGGASLQQQLATLRKDPRGTVALAIKICEALAAIHDQGVVHKDINPSNIIYCSQTGRLQIIDFGIATLLASEESFFSRSHLLEGTIAYISPEQTGRMNRPLDYRTDFYSLGVTLHELFTENLPFIGDDLLQLIHHHMAHSPEPFAAKHRLSPTLQQIIFKLMDKDPEQRYQSAVGIAYDLRQCLRFWDSAATMTLGGGDTRSHFSIPSQLYGRKQQIDELIQAFARTANGTTEIVIVQGTSGIGKSALVGEVRKPIAQGRGIFIAGKFDQYNQNTSYEPFIRAFRELIKTLITRGTQELKLWQQRIRLELKNNGGVLAEVLPELCTVTGPWPVVRELPPLETIARFRMVIEDFVRAVATVQQPLVLFLDDLQWADPSSLNLIEFLSAGQDQQSLLLILGFRDNEVGPNHPLRAMLLSLKNHGIEPRTLTMGPLELPDITQFVADSLRTAPDAVAELAELCASKTAGNPFFLRQLLLLLHERRLISFVPATQSFDFNLDEIRTFPISDNVVDLILTQLQLLSAPAQQVIAHAACVGGEFDLDILAGIMQLARQQIARNLRVPLAQSLVIPLDPEYRQAEDEAAIFNVRYRFAHDRIQQAALQLISEDQLTAVNLGIGRYHRQQHASSGTHLIDAVFRLYAARRLLSEAELIDLAALAAEAGAVAAASSANDTAFNLFALGIELLGATGWERATQLCRTLHGRLLKIAHHAGQSEKMATYFRDFVHHTPDALQQVDAQVAMMESLAQQALCADALNLANAYLARLGVKIPRHGSLAYAISCAPIILFRVRPGRLARLEHDPELCDQRLMVINRLLTSMTHVATFYDPILAAIIAMKQVLLMFDHGVSEGGLVGLGNLACVFNVKVLQRYGLAQITIRTALKILLARAYRWGYTRASYLALALIDGWTQPPRRDDPKLEDVAQDCFDQGNFEDGCQSLTASIYTREYCWEQLGPLLASAGSLLKTIHRFNLVSIETYTKVAAQGLANLATRVAEPWVLDGEFASEQELRTTIEATDDNLSRFVFWREKGTLASIYGEHAKAVAAFAQGAPYRRTCEAFAHLAHYSQIFKTFSHLQLLKPLAIKTILALIVMFADLLYVRIIARANPIAYDWSRLLIRAEVYRLLGWRLLALGSFLRARMKARASGYLMPQAFVSECLGRFYLEHGDEVSGQQTLREARHIYLDWGALGKVSHLEESFPMLREATATSPALKRTSGEAMQSVSQNGSTIDLESILRGTQAISSELQFDTLIQRLMKITLENAGARQAYLLLLEGNELYCRVRGVVDPTLTITAMNTRVEELAHEMCTSLALYVARCGETVVLADAHQSAGTYQTDPYMATGTRRSMACLPIENQGKCIGVLYLENELSTQVFTPERMKTLALLAAQGAISLKNVQYVENLKEKARLENDLLAAHAVQEALLPASGFKVPGIELTSYYGSAEQTGGDWFGAHYDAARELLYLQIGDVTGHGIPSALVTAAVCGAILSAHRLIAAMPDFSPEQAIWHLAMAANDAVATTGKRVGRLMTMAFIVLKVPTGEGIYCNAAHIPVLIRNHGMVNRLCRRGVFLGEFAADEKPELIKFLLEPGDVLFMATDGLFENGADSTKPVMMRVLQKIIQQELPPEEIKAAIHAAYERLLGTSKPDDDCTYVILRRSPV